MVVRDHAAHRHLERGPHREVGADRGRRRQGDGLAVHTRRRLEGGGHERGRAGVIVEVHPDGIDAVGPIAEDSRVKAVPLHGVGRLAVVAEGHRPVTAVGQPYVALHPHPGQRPVLVDEGQQQDGIGRGDRLAQHGVELRRVAHGGRVLGLRRRRRPDELQVAQRCGRR